MHHGKWPDRTPWGAEDGGAVQADYQGYVLLHPDQAGRLYVKGIHVANSNVPLGFDFDALSVDRDRKHITGPRGRAGSQVGQEDVDRMS